MPIESLPTESPEYRKLRQELLEAEIALRDQRERVAELRARADTGRQRLAALEQEARVVAEHAEELRTRRERLAQSALGAAEKARRASELLTRTETELAGLLERRSGLESERGGLEQKIGEQRDTLASLEEDARQTRSEVERLRCPP